jgi:hypothetical protein
MEDTAGHRCIYVTFLQTKSDWKIAFSALHSFSPRDLALTQTVKTGSTTWAFGE